MQTQLKRSTVAVLSFLLPSLTFGGPLKQHYQGYPSPAGSVGHKSLGLVEVAGGGYAVWVAQSIANRNSYRKFTKAYDEYQRAVREYESAGGIKVKPAAGEKDVAVAVETEAAAAGKTAGTATTGTPAAEVATGTPVAGGPGAAAGAAEVKAAATEAGTAAEEVKAAANESATAASEVKAAAESGAGTARSKSALVEAAEATERAADRLRTAANRVPEAMLDAARESEVASRALHLRGSTDKLARAATRMLQARQQLLTTAGEVLAQEGTTINQAFVPLQSMTADNLVVPKETLAEARSINAAIRTATIVGRLAGVLLVGDGIYRLYLIHDMRSPGVFPLGWAAFVGARKLVVRDSSHYEPATVEEVTLPKEGELAKDREVAKEKVRERVRELAKPNKVDVNIDADNEKFKVDGEIK